MHRDVHSCTCTICENNMRNKNPKSLQVVQAHSVCACGGGGGGGGEGGYRLFT